MIALILARGGSKGLPGKNVLPFRGKPLIAHTIEAGLSSQSVDRVIVSTDDPEIAEVSRTYGAEIPFLRPAELATDTASSLDAMLHAIDHLTQNGDAPHTFCLLQPTSPLRTADDIDAASELFFGKQADSVLSVTPYDHPVQWAVRVSDNGQLTSRQAKKGSRRQDCISYYRLNGAIYIFQPEFLNECGGNYIGGNTYGYIMPRERSLDIDTKLDFVIAEAVACYLESQTC